MKNLRVQKVFSGGVSLDLWDAGGDGFPFVFQHGLCGGIGQVREGFPVNDKVRLICLECRGHGRNELGPVGDISIAQFTDDLLGALDELGIRRYAVGGISMGAAISLRVASLRSEQVAGLALVRPAWLFEKRPKNAEANILVGQLLKDFGADEGLKRFLESPTARDLKEGAPDNLASLVSFFARQPVLDTAELLTRIPEDWPGVSLEQAAALQIPTLVLGNDRDEVHPLAMAQELAAAVPGARFSEVTSKAVDKAGYLRDLHRELNDFVARIL